MCRNGETETGQCFEQRFGKSGVKIPQSTGTVIPKFKISFGNDSDMYYSFIISYQIIVKGKKVLELGNNTSLNSFNKWTKISSLEITIFDLKVMVKCGLDFFLF